MTFKEKLIKLRDVSSEKEPSGPEETFVREIARDPMLAAFFFSRESISSYWLELGQELILESDSSDRSNREIVKYAFNALADNENILSNYCTKIVNALNLFDLHSLLDLIVEREELNPLSFYDIALEFTSRRNNGFDRTFSRYVSKLLDQPEQNKENVINLFAAFFTFHKVNGETFAAFQKHEFHQVTNGTFREAVKFYPFEMAKMTVESYVKFVHLEYSEDIENSGSFIRTVHGKTKGYESLEEGIVKSLCYACVETYCEGSDEQIIALDQHLQSELPALTKVRRYCYSKSPNRVFEKVKTELESYFLEVPDSDHPYEIRELLSSVENCYKASDFGEGFFSAITGKILSGPSKSKYKEKFERYGQEGDFEIAFSEARKHYHLRMLLPLGTLLESSTLGYVEELKCSIDGPKSVEDLQDLDNSYGKVHSVEVESPISAFDLGALSDEKILEYLNNWEPDGEDGEDPMKWWIKTNKEGLASTLREVVTHDQERFSKWGSKVLEFNECIYCRAFLDAGTRCDKNSGSDSLGNWLQIAEFMLNRVSGDSGHDDSVNELEYTARGVLELTQSIVTSTIGMTRVQAEGAYRILLGLLCIELPLEKDTDVEKFNIDRVFSRAINHTRSRAIEALFTYQEKWREHFGDKADFLGCSTNEIASTALEERKVQEPFANFELSMLGVSSARLAHYDRKWTEDNWSIIFPPISENELGWVSSFGSYLLSSRCQGWLYDLLEKEYVTAVKNLEAIRKSDGRDEKALTRLGFHLFQLYLWGKIDSLSESSLIGEYHASMNSKERRDYLSLIVHGLQGKDPLQPELAERCERYVDFIAEQFSVEEIERLSYCLSANLMSDEWRLSMFKLYLEKQEKLGPSDWVSLYTMDDLFDSDPKLSLECLELLTSLLLKGGNNWNFDAEEIGNILKMAVQKDKPELLHLIEKIQENLLRLGRFESLDWI